MDATTRAVLEVLGDLVRDVSPLYDNYGIDILAPDNAPLDLALSAWGAAGCPNAAPPDLTDRATFLLALDDLAKRVGLDLTGGVLWLRIPLPPIPYDPVDRSVWVLDNGRGAQSFPIATDDPVAALRAALETTEPAA